MALTKFDIASAALVIIGANPVASFDSAGTTEQIACHHLYQTCVDHWLSLYPWRFATRTLQMPRASLPPDTQWRAAYVAPSGMKAMQAIRLNADGPDMPFDRFENLVLCDASDTSVVWAVHTHEPPIAWWPGYFVQLVEIALAEKLSFAISGKLDLQLGLSKTVDMYFRLAKNADSRQQTTRRFKVAGRGSILQIRRS